MLQKFLNFITFVDLPIKKKFLLFSLGVLFWFVTMYIVGIAANIIINDKIDQMVNNVIPYDRVAHKITRKLQSLGIDASEIVNISDSKLADQRIDRSKARLLDIKSLISTLMFGGQFNDIDRDTDELIESLTVTSSEGVPEIKEYSGSMKPLLADLETSLSEVISILKNNVQDKSLLLKNINEYGELISASTALTVDFSVKVAKMHISNSAQIKTVINYTLYAFTGVLLLATTLLIIFTLTISTSISLLVNSIIEQIRSLGTGKVDLTKKIEVRSKDEIGTLSKEFNKLTEEIYEIVTFKKVIEEDDCLEDVYSRLGKAFNDLSLDEYTIYEVSENKCKITPVYPLMINTKEMFCSEEILTNCSLCKVEKTGHTINSMSFPNICKHFKPDLNKDHICIPMIIGGKTGGIVQFLFDRQDFNENRKDKKLFKAEQYIKESLSVIEAKRLTNTLRESALKDSLTDLYNRRFLQEYTETLIAGVLRRKNVVGLIMCDLDFFKQVNDHYGHNVGDAVLKETATVIKNCVRSADLVIRFGGEEFLVLMLDVKEGETFKTAEKIRKAIEETKVKVTDGIIKKTISLGVSEFPLDGESFWQTIKFADVALYKAKETGRNKSVRFTEDMWSENGF